MTDKDGYCTDERECKSRQDEINRLELLVLQAFQRYVIRGGGYDPLFEDDAEAIVAKRKNEGKWVPLGTDR